MNLHRFTTGTWFALMIALFVSPAFAGGTQENAATGPSDDEHGQTPETMEDTGELVIWSDEARSAVMQEIGAAFAAETGVAVEVQMMGFGDIRDQLAVAGPAGEGPDILIGAHDWLGQLVANGLVEPMDLGVLADEFLPNTLQAYTYDGQLYGMPYQLDNVAFVRNTDLVPDAPQTWSEVRRIAERLQEQGHVEYGFIRQEGDPYHFFPIQSAFGGYVFGRDGAGTYRPDDVGIDDPGSLAAAEWLEAMVQAGNMPDGVDFNVLHSMFEQGQTAMIVTGPWALPRLNESGVPFAVSAVPGEVRDAQPFLGVQGFMISAFSENKLLAQTFLTEYVATEETMVELYRAVPRSPAFRPAVDDVGDPQIAAFGRAGLTGVPMPAIPEMSAVWSAWTDAIVLVTQGRQDATDAFRNAAAQIRSTLAGE